MNEMIHKNIIEQDQNTNRNIQEEAQFAYEQFLRIMAVVLVMVISLFLVSCSRKSELTEKTADYAFYIKDSQIHYVNLENLEEIEPKQLTEQWYKFDEKIDIYTINSDVALMQKNNVVVFPDDAREDGAVSKLYYKDFDKEERDLIAEDVLQYQISADGEQVLYIKEANNELYHWDFNLKQSEKLADEVREYQFSKDSKKVLFIDDKDDLYTKVKGSDKKLIASKIDFLDYADPDFTEFVYSKGTDFYRMIDGKEVKFAENVVPIRFLSAKEGYYLTDERQIPWKELVIDDLSEGEKKANLLKDLEEMEQRSEGALTMFTLWYMKDGESQKISDRYLSWAQAQHPSAFMDGWMVQNGAKLFFREFDLDKFEKIKLSELDDPDSLFRRIYDQSRPIADFRIAIGGRVEALPEINTQSVEVTPSGTKLCFTKNIDPNGINADLYVVHIESGNISEPELIDQQVSDGHSQFIDDDTLVYFRAKDEFTGDLYINGKHIDENVNTYRIEYNKDRKELIYYADWNRGIDHGKLKIYSNGETKLIAERVHDAHFVNSGKVVYTTDFNFETGKGKIHVYNGQKSERIAQDVDFLIYPMKAGENLYHIEWF